MKKSVIVLISVVSISTALPALAGPDWLVINQGRKAKAARMQQAAAQQLQSSGSSASGTNSSGTVRWPGHPDQQKRVPGRN